MSRILVTGALGQIGSELVPALRARYGPDQVVASDVRPSVEGTDRGPFEVVDCVHISQIDDAITRYDVATVYHLAGLLSAVAEGEPRRAGVVNMGGLFRVLEVARERRCAVFFPSSIGAFGPSTPRDGAPQVTIQRPTTMYGITKLASELLCDYYASHHGLDTRGLRLPGLISHVTPPGGGTTDWAVEIFYAAASGDRYTCFLRSDSRLDMMYMPDALRAMIELMETDPACLTHRNAFNITAMQLTPEILAAEIRRRMPDFSIDYDVDPVRQAIADSWPDRLDDSAARNEWGWEPRWDLRAMTDDMLDELATKPTPARQPGRTGTP